MFKDVMFLYYTLIIIISKRMAITNRKNGLLREQKFLIKS